MFFCTLFFCPILIELTQPYTFVGPPVKGPVLAPIAVNYVVLSKM